MAQNVRAVRPRIITRALQRSSDLGDCYRPMPPNGTRSRDCRVIRACFPAVGA
jgi:hypothetical protein